VVGRSPNNPPYFYFFYLLKLVRASAVGSFILHYIITLELNYFIFSLEELFLLFTTITKTKAKSKLIDLIFD